MKNKSALASLITFLIISMAIIGEIKCVIKFCRCDFQAPYKAEAIYGLGAITGFGSIIGYLDINDKSEPAKTTTIKTEK